MSLKPVPLFGIGNQGKSPNVNDQQRKNLYIEINQDAEKHVLTMYPTPGLVTFVNSGATPIRGTYEKGVLMYVVHRNKLYSVTANGTTAVLGTLATYSGRVSFSDNGTEIALVDGPNGYIWDTVGNTFTQITSTGFVGGTAIRFLNGRFVANRPGTGEFCISAAYDGLTWDELEFATAESAPDELVSLEVENGQLVLFGDKTTEFWGDSGAADFPLARIGSSAIEWGLAASQSLSKFMDSLIFLRKNRLGQVQVCVQSGASAQPVSTPDVETQFSSYGDVSDATGFAYMLGGHPFYQINFPTADKSWLYDGQSKAWSELESAGGRHRAEMYQQFLGALYVTDYENGKLYRLDADVYSDDGATIVRQFQGRHQSSGDFSTFAELWLEMEAGVGLQAGQGSNPQVMMQISKDGGHTWGAERWAGFGAAGKYTSRAKWNRLGRARDWVFRFRITDPVKTVFTAAWGR
jgi:hypothetical protein